MPGLSVYFKLSLNSPAALRIPTSCPLNLSADAVGLLSVNTAMSPAVPLIVISCSLVRLAPENGLPTLVIR